MKPMLDALIDIDRKLLLLLNHLNNGFFDFIFWWSSDKEIWIPFYLFLALLLFKDQKKHFLYLLFFIAAAVTFSDQVASGFIKEQVMRLRPCHDLEIGEQVRILHGYCGGKFGFVSSHAANVFTLASFLSLAFASERKLLIRIMWIWAVIVSYSRIYLGVHYPGDIIGGAILGIFSGIVFYRAYFYFFVKIKINNNHHKSR